VASGKALFIIGKSPRYMNTIENIERAVEKLPADKLAEFAAWFQEFQTLIGSSAEVFGMYDREES
jgi:hypothetical protein